MGPTELIGIINRIEDKFPVDSWSIKEIHIWPLIRFELKFRLFQRYHLATTDEYRNTVKQINYISSIMRILRSFLKYTSAYWADFKHNQNIESAVKIVFLTYTTDRTLIRDVWYNKYCDPFGDVFQKMDMRTLTLEAEAGNCQYRIPRYRPSVFIQQRINYLEIKNRLLRKEINLESENLNGFSDFLKFLESEDYGIESPSLKDLRCRINVILEISAYFKNIFNRLQPSIAFVADYYSTIDRLAFNLVSRKMGISCVDIQHGTAGEYHPAYGRWNRIPEGGYELLPAIFWCWSEEEAGAILKWNKNVSGFHKPFVGGNLWLNLWKDQHNEMVKYYDSQIAKIKFSINKPVFILYTFDKIYSIPEWLIDAIKSSADSFLWWIRMHPSQSGERKVIQDLFKKRNLVNFEIDLATDFPLAALLRHTDVHVTATSSSAKEAAYFGVPSVFTHEEGAVFHSEQIASGMALEAYSKEGLLEAIQIQIEKKKKNKTTLPQKELFPNNADIIKQFLKEVNQKKR